MRDLFIEKNLIEFLILQLLEYFYILKLEAIDCHDSDLLKDEADHKDYLENKSNSSPLIRLIECKKQLAIVSERLEKERKNFHQNLSEINDNAKQIDEKEKLLNASFRNYERFFDESKKKISRASAIIENQNQECIKMEKLYEKEKVTKQQMDDEIRKIEDEIKDLEKYEAYLNSSNLDGVKSIEIMIAKYEILESNMNHLSQSNKQLIIEQNQLQQDNLKILDGYQSKLMSLKNNIGSLEMRLEDAESETHHWHSKWMHIQATAAKKTLKLGKMKMAIHNLYSSIIPHIKPGEDRCETDARKQLKHIGRFMRETAEVLQYLEENEEVDVDSMQTNKKNLN
ncbi:MAG: Coiled-coil domain-containing protein 42 [Marteilia pararefringens]